MKPGAIVLDVAGRKVSVLLIQLLCDAIILPSALQLLDRVQKATHPSLAEGNRERLGVLLRILYDYAPRVWRKKGPHIEECEHLVETLWMLNKVCGFPLVVFARISLLEWSL